MIRARPVNTVVAKNALNPKIGSNAPQNRQRRTLDDRVAAHSLQTNLVKRKPLPRCSPPKNAVLRY